MVIRGLSGTFDVEEVIAYLKGLRLNLNIRKLTKLGRDSWLLQMGRDSDISGFYEVRYILHCRVYLDKFKRSGLTQCFNCQRFGTFRRTVRCLLGASSVVVHMDRGSVRFHLGTKIQRDPTGHGAPAGVLCFT